MVDASCSRYSMRNRTIPHLKSTPPDTGCESNGPAKVFYSLAVLAFAGLTCESHVIVIMLSSGVARLRMSCEN